MIDDHDVAREYMSRLLGAHGFHVESQASAIGATRAIVREHISVVVLDVEMPALTGDKLIALFRQNPRFDKLGIVLVSGKNRDELEAFGKAVGANAVVPKKFLEQELVSTVESVLASCSA